MDSGEGISQFDYLLDAQGRKIQANEKFWIDSQVKQNKVDWTYDNAGRLVREKFDHYDDAFDQTLEFAYDLVGNRLSQTVDKGNDGVIDQVFAYHYDANDRLLEEFFDGQNDGTFEKVTNYGYDHTQQTSKSVSENGTLVSDTTFEYDLQGRMVVVTVVSYDEFETVIRQERTTYKYGADGIRVSALHEIDADGDGVYESKKLTEYLNDSKSLTGYSQVLRQTDYDESGAVIQSITYIIGLQRIKQIVTDNQGVTQEYYFTFDGHGSTRVLTDALGAIVQYAGMGQVFHYDAYGNALGFVMANALTEFLYSGEQFDAKIGQQYLRARYYDSATGRFNRLDPFFGNLSDPQSLHNYLYCHADPVSMVDPTGKVGVAVIVAALSLGFGIATTIGQVSVGASWEKAIHSGLCMTATTALAFAFAAPILQIWSVFAGANFLLFDSPRQYNKWYLDGNGGLDGTDVLKNMRDEIISKWRNLDDDVLKMRIINSLHTIQGPFSWDIAELFDKKSKPKWTQDINSPALETLTFQGHVYPIAEVNYLLWGMINHLAWEEGFAPAMTNWCSMQGMVLLYRCIWGPVISIYQNAAGNPPSFETTSGKLAWARYGWNWVNEEWPEPPIGERVYNAVPNQNKWTTPLEYRVGKSFALEVLFGNG